MDNILKKIERYENFIIYNHNLLNNNNFMKLVNEYNYKIYNNINEYEYENCKRNVFENFIILENKYSNLKNLKENINVIDFYTPM